MSESTTEVTNNNSVVETPATPVVQAPATTFNPGVPSSASAELFHATLEKVKLLTNPVEVRAALTPEEFRSICVCYGWMDNDERAKFAITRADLTEEEIRTYDRSLQLNVYWPV